jgi:hypothetical protein
VPAEVVRIVALPFGTRQVGLRFRIAHPVQLAHVRAWHETWLQVQRQRLLDQRAA